MGNLFTETLGRAIEAGLLVELPQATIERLASDLEETADELDQPGADDSIDAVLAEWLRRIGGWGNVPAYAETLLAGDRRRGVL